MDEYDGSDDDTYDDLERPDFDDPFAAVEQLESADARVEDLAAEAADEQFRHEIAMSFLEGDGEVTETETWSAPKSEPGKF
jgi:hypothetical protein